MNTSPIFKSDEKSKFGFFAVLATVIGIVIGSGIFVKNDAVLNGTESALLTIISWVLVSVIIIFMILTFNEVSSSTSKTGEVGTPANWMNKFVGPKASQATMVLFTFFYFPIINAAIATYSADKIVEVIAVSSSNLGYIGNTTIGWGEWLIFLATFMIGAIIIFGLYYLNIYSTKGSKFFQQFGTFFAIIPLFFIIFTVSIMLIVQSGGGTVYPENLGGGKIVDPIYNVGMNDGGFSSFTKVFLIAPTIVYSFAGFILPMSLETEAKSRRTFRTAFFLGITVITVLYLSFTLASLSTLQIVDGELTSISVLSMVDYLFKPETASWLSPMMSVFVIMALLSTVSAYTIIASRGLANASADNTILDKKGQYIVRNNQGISKSSAIFMMKLCLIWYVVLKGLDALSLATATAAVNSGELATITGTHHYFATGYISDIITLLVTIPYGLLILFTWINRKTKKVDVDRQRFYEFFAIFVLFFLSLSLITQTGNVFIQLFNFKDSLWLGKSLIPFFSLVIIGTGFILAYNYNSQKVKLYTDKDYKNKSIMIGAYNSFMGYEEYLVKLGQYNSPNAKKVREAEAIKLAEEKANIASTVNPKSPRKNSKSAKKNKGNMEKTGKKKK